MRDFDGLMPNVSIGMNTAGGALIVDRIQPALDEINLATSLQVGRYDER